MSERMAIPYAFRTFRPFGMWHDGRSSAEWPEDMALELGDRVSESWFAFQMWAAVMLSIAVRKG